MEQEPQHKVIFGLSQRATIINAVVLLIIAQLFWCLYFIKIIPEGFNISDYSTEYGATFIKDIPWYVDTPFQILSMVLVLYWVEHKYHIEKSDYSWRGIKYKFVYPVFGFTIVGSITKILILLILL